VTAQHAGYEASPQEIIPAQASGTRRLHCAHCGAVGTHYLTCSRLQLPSGYRFSDDDRPVTASRGTSSGPDHPDWPRPPQR
jgi:hypothetical protein